MVAICFRNGCNWRLDCAHMDDAIDHLRAHYRALHPTKAFYERDTLERLESYNRTADEIVAAWNNAPADQPEAINWRNLGIDIRRYRQYEEQGDGYLNLDALVELERRYDEWQAANPAPQPAHDAAVPAVVVFPRPGVGDPFQDPGPDGVLAVDEAVDRHLRGPGLADREF